MFCNPLCKYFQPKSELLYEAETIKLLSTLSQKFYPGIYQIHIGSSELLDAIMDECNVKLQDRPVVLRLLSKSLGYSSKNFKHFEKLKQICDSKRQAPLEFDY